MKVEQSKAPWQIGIVSLGTLLEWAEYTFYGYMALTLSTLFFPASDAKAALIKTFGIFAVGYIMRPLGALIFGAMGDNLGRRPALMASLWLMGLATFAIGCLPTYATIGILAPLLLLLMRLLQGIAISGEYNGAGIFLVEKSRNNPCLAGSWVSASAAGGMVLGGIAALATSHPSAPLWAWRVPFLLGGMSCFIGIWCRRGLSESPYFLQKDQKNKRIPLLGLLKQYQKSFILAGAIAAFTGVFVYIGNIYIVVFLKKIVMLPVHHATLFAIFGEIIVAIMIPIMAYVADKTDAYRQYRLGLCLVALFSPITFMLCYTGNYGLIALAMVIYGVLNGVACGPMVKILCDLFPPSVRYTGVSFAWSVSAALFAGTAPLVAEILTIRYNWLMGPSLYVSLIALVTFGLCKSLTPKPLISTLNGPLVPSLTKS
jgi:MHS family proline/betaine transporter-like MFS transporter